MPPGTPVEARSLTSLTTLAANPPAYPRNPTQKPLEPLVLYIVRVPGSKDVFLSPLKPPTKSSVSPESLNASLYFLHVSGPDDDAVRESIEQERRVDLQNTYNENTTASEQAGDRDSKFALLNRIQRKPVPGTASTTATQDQASPPKSSLDGCIAGKQDEPVLENPQRGPSPEKHSSNERATLPRRPLPPLPADHEDQLLPPIAGGVPPGRASWDGEPRQRNLPAPATVTDNNTSPGRVSWDGGRQPFHLAGLPLSRTNAGQYLVPPTGPTAGYPGHRQTYDKERETQLSSRMPRPFHVTLIRRDPTHGHQWNVGTITNSSSTAPSEVAADSTITIEIMTPGYKRFAGDSSMPVSLESLGITQASSPRLSIPSPSQQARDTNLPSESSEPANTGPTGPLNFVRKVAMSQHTAAASNSSPHSTKHVSNLSHAHPHPQPPKSTRANYTFTSPWNGTCTFTTGPNGRSLKCKHVIPSPATTTTTTTTARSDQEADSPPAVTVGEIRFNLPSTTTMGRVPTPAATPSHLHRQQHHHHHHHHSGHSPSSSSSTPAFSTSPTRQTALDPPLHRAGPELEPEPEPAPEPGRLDLRLGRERAGGGLRGRSAKLGKLIIEDEGMKMLDLLVAACMGVWWGVYDQD